MKLGVLTGMSISPPGFPNKVYVAGWTVPQAIAVILTVDNQPFGATVTKVEPPIAGTFIWVIPDIFQDGKTRYITGQVIDSNGKILGPLDNSFKLTIPK